MFYIPPILVVSTFSQHIILSLYECGVLLCQCLSVYIFAMCKYMLSDFRKRISILSSFYYLSFAFIHISCVLQVVMCLLVLFLSLCQFILEKKRKFNITVSQWPRQPNLPITNFKLHFLIVSNQMYFHISQSTTL